MNSLLCRLSLIALLSGLVLCGKATPVFAAEQDRGGPGDQLERLERRVTELAERQEQIMRRMEALAERQQQPMRPRVAQPERREQFMRQSGARSEPPAVLPPAGPDNLQRPLPPAAPPIPGPGAPGALHHQIGELVKLCLLVGFIFNILLAIWIYTDIRKRGEGSGIFIALALFAGIPAAIIYSLVRLGDKKT